MFRLFFVGFLTGVVSLQILEIVLLKSVACSLVETNSAEFVILGFKDSPVIYFLRCLDCQDLWGSIIGVFFFYLKENGW